MNGLFGLNGITGYLIAVVLLLSIVFALGYSSIVVQQREASNPYAIKGNAVPNPKTIEDVYANLHELKIDSKANAAYAVEKN
jgi:hypothetical protein